MATETGTRGSHDTEEGLEIEQILKGEESLLTREQEWFERSSEWWQRSS